MISIESFWQPSETAVKYQVMNVPSITSPKGFTASGIHCGIKRKRLDLGLLVCEVPAATAGVYTLNRLQAAPLQVTRQALGVDSHMEALICNSGIANACTGKRGLEDARMMQTETAQGLGIPAHRVGVASTGLIGDFLPMNRIRMALPSLIKGQSREGHVPFSQSILTTDTRTKEAEVRLQVEGKEVRIAGVAKGSGMINPHMATMLAFMTTDAVISPEVLQGLLGEVTDKTFNRITVDGDTSTNDMVTVMASGLAGHSPLSPGHPDWKIFREGFAFVAQELAKKIARDGEGATRLVEVQVIGAGSEEKAVQAAKSVVGSSLVKTAVYGADPNWGRILCALGYSGSDMDPEKVDVSIGSVPIIIQGQPVNFDEEAARACLKEETVILQVNLHQGVYQAKAWGCDLTYDYVRINANYSS